MYEARKAEYIEKLPTGFHSTKGLGKTAPDNSNVKEIDGATVVAFYIDCRFSLHNFLLRSQLVVESRIQSFRQTCSTMSSLSTMLGR